MIIFLASFRPIWGPPLANVGGRWRGPSIQISDEIRRGKKITRREKTSIPGRVCYSWAVLAYLARAKYPNVGQKSDAGEKDNQIDKNIYSRKGFYFWAVSGLFGGRRRWRTLAEDGEVGAGLISKYRAKIRRGEKDNPIGEHLFAGGILLLGSCWPIWAPPTLERAKYRTKSDAEKR